MAKLDKSAESDVIEGMIRIVGSERASVVGDELEKL
jgi:hypothetical protein